MANSPNSSRSASFAGVLANFDAGMHPQAQHTGYYNDLDMMVDGMPGLTEAQDQVHMSLGAISGLPLLVGADLTKLNKESAAMLTNPEVVAIDQDALGVQAIKLDEPSPGLQVWSRPLAGTGKHEVVFLNRTSTPAKMVVQFKQLGLNPSLPAQVRAIWADKNGRSFTANYSATVAPSESCY